jgi:glucosamine--fructose-6-phosphate aminotransferase (isomerizing)
MFVGSDAIALAPFTDAIAYRGRRLGGVDRTGNCHPRPQRQFVDRPVTRSQANALIVDKGNHATSW